MKTLKNENSIGRVICFSLCLGLSAIAPVESIQLYGAAESASVKECKYLHPILQLLVRLGRCVRANPLATAGCGYVCYEVSQDYYFPPAEVCEQRHANCNATALETTSMVLPNGDSNPNYGADYRAAVCACMNASSGCEDKRRGLGCID
jgi:hypothetical protein